MIIAIGSTHVNASLSSGRYLTGFDGSGALIATERVESRSVLIGQLVLIGSLKLEQVTWDLVIVELMALFRSAAVGRTFHCGYRCSRDQRVETPRTSMTSSKGRAAGAARNSKMASNLVAPVAPDMARLNRCAIWLRAHTPRAWMFSWTSFCTNCQVTVMGSIAISGQMVTQGGCK